jgi:hypothetical protein
MERWCSVVLLLLPLVACTPDYPMDKQDTWQPPVVGSNEKNLRVMLVNPQDLVAGTGEDNSMGAEAAPPVHRLVTGKRTPLPSSNAAVFQINTSPEPGAAGGGVGAPAQ